MKTLEKVPMSVVFVHELPFENLERGVLYINKEKMLFAHRCLCDCERLVNIPIQRFEQDGVVESSNDSGWNLTIIGENATVTPSILNKPCECHYIITKGIANIV